jgi:hypothetical protein
VRESESHCLLMVCLLCKREGERMSQKEKDKKRDE